MTTPTTTRCRPVCATFLLLCIAAWLIGPSAYAAPPDRSVHFPDGWTSATIQDSEASCGWRPAQGPDELSAEYTSFKTVHAKEARARGNASCRLTFATKADGLDWCELRASAAPTDRFDALSVWIKNPGGLHALCWLKIQDADEVVYSVPSVLLGEELNWYEIAFRLRDYVPAVGAVDKRPGINFPVKGISLVLSDLRPDTSHLFYIDELQAHFAPPPELDVIELSGPREVRAGDDIALRIRLRAQSKVPEDLRLNIGLALNESPACLVSSVVSVPVGGAEPGDILPPLQTRFSLPAHVAEGTYTVTITADNARILLPGPDRLPTSRIAVGAAGVAAGRSSIRQIEGLPRIMIGERPARVCFSVTDLSDAAQMAALRKSNADIVRFRVAIGGTMAGAVPVQWEGPDAWDFGALTAAVSQLLAASPSAMLLPDLVLSAPDWWLVANRGECALLARGSDAYDRASYPSMASQVWRKDAGAALAAAAGYLEAGPFSGHVAGYQISGGFQGRWLAIDPDTSAAGDFSATQQRAFQAWLKTRYGDLPNLRGAWSQPVKPATGRPNVAPAVLNWTDVEVPDARLQEASNTWLLDPATHASVIDYRLFCSEQVVATIEDLAGVVKAVAGDGTLCGAAYGHFLELAATKSGLQQGGHLALTKALQSRNLDFLVGPPNSLAPGAPLMPEASIARAGKVLLPSSDTGPTTWEGVAAGLRTSGMANLVATCPDGMVGEWLECAAGPHPAEIAVIVDDVSAAHLAQGSPVPAALLTSQMRQLRRTGAPTDVWTLEDFASGNVSGYKLYVFADAFKVDGPFVKQAVGAHIRETDVALWICAPGAIGTFISSRRIKDITGIAVSAVMSNGALKATVSAPGAVFTDGLQTPLSFGLNGPASPHFEVFDSLVTVLAEDGAGRPALVAKPGETGTMLYSVAPNVPSSLLRSIARGAGVHIFSNSDDPVCITRSLITLTSPEGTPRDISLPGPASVVALGSGAKVSDGETRFLAQVPVGGSAAFLVAPASP